MSKTNIIKKPKTKSIKPKPLKTFSSSVADSLFRVDFIVKFEKDIGEAGDNVICIIFILFFLLSRIF